MKKDKAKITVSFEVETKGKVDFALVKDFVEAMFIDRQSTSSKEGTIVYDRNMTQLEISFS